MKILSKIRGLFFNSRKAKKRKKKQNRLEEENRELIDSYTSNCSICGNESNFRYFGGSVRESYRCAHCKGSLRERSQSSIILQLYGNKATSFADLVNEDAFLKLKIFEPGIMGPFRRHFENHPNYMKSFYHGNYRLGEIVDGVINEDLQQLSMESNYWDLIITSDIFEHVRKPFLAFKEIHRTLKKGGRHIFTIPTHYPWEVQTIYRVDTSGSEDVFVLPPVYHGNGAGGKSLVYTDFGQDLITELEKMGMKTEYVITDINSPHLKKNITFISQKL